jgi:hypothetical protein
MKGRPLVVLVCAALLLSACGSGIPTPDAATATACQRFAALVHRIDAGKLKDRKGKKGRKVKRRVRRAVAAIVAQAKASGDPDVVKAAENLVARAREGAAAVRAATAELAQACVDAGVSDSSSPAATPSASASPT